MELLKQEIASTIYVPDFFKVIPQRERDEVIRVYFDVLDQYFAGVSKIDMSNRVIRNICFRIDSLSADLAQLTPPHIYLQSWLLLGSTVEDWIQFACNHEEFEVAANLRKLLNSEYV